MGSLRTGSHGCAGRISGEEKLLITSTVNAWPASQSLEAGPALDSGAGGAGTRRVSAGLAFRVPKDTGRGGLTQMPILIPRNDEYVTLYGIRSFAGVIKGLEKGALITLDYLGDHKCPFKGERKAGESGVSLEQR